MRKVDSEGGRAVRQRESVPLLTTFGERLTGKGRRAPPKRAVGQSIVYPIRIFPPPFGAKAKKPVAA